MKSKKPPHRTSAVLKVFKFGVLPHYHTKGKGKSQFFFLLKGIHYYYTCMMVGWFGKVFKRECVCYRVKFRQHQYK